MKELFKNFKKGTALYFLAALLEITGEIVWAYYFMATFDYASGDAVYVFSRLILFSVGIILFRGLTTFLTGTAGANLQKQYRKKLNDAIVRRYLKDPVGKTSSEILNMVTTIGKQLEQMFLMPAMSVIKYAVFFIGGSVAIFRIRPVIFLLILLVAWIPFVLPKIFDKKNQTLRSDAMKQTEFYISKVKELTTGSEVVKSFHIEDKIGALSEKENAVTEEKRFRSNRFQAFHENFSGVLSLASFLAINLAGVYMVKNGTMTIGQLVAVTQLSNYVQAPLMLVPKSFVMMKSVAPAKKEIDEYIEPLPAPTSKAPFSMEKELDVEDLRYAYDSADVLKGLDFKVKPGEKIAILGESGSGKSTLAKVLLRRLPEYRGSIAFDGHELNTIDRDAFYDGVSPVTQEVFLFNDTIRNNITLYQDVADEDLQAAVEEAGLKKVVDALPDGLDTVIGEYGTDLSGGEKQRISIARCLIKDADFIIMDEATSSLDINTARSVEDLVLGLDPAVLVITHRIDPMILKRYDRVYVLIDGEFKEQGRWEDLEYAKTNE